MMWIVRLFFRAIFIVAIDPSDVNMPISLGGIYNDVTDFCFVDKAIKLSGIDGYSPLLRIRKRLSNALLKGITIRRELA